MIEIIDNALQFGMLSVCAIYSIFKFVQHKSNKWFLLSCFYGSYLLGLTFWLLHLIFFLHTPDYFYVSELSWMASYLFLIVLLRGGMTNEEKKRFSPVLLCIPIISISLCLFYFQRGDYLLNVLWGSLMCVMGYHALRGLLYVSKQDGMRGRKLLCTVSLILFLVEYSLWTVSCFWPGDSLDPYFFMDVCLTFSLSSFIFVGRKEADI